MKRVLWFVIAVMIAASACQKKTGRESRDGVDSARVDASPGMMPVPGDSLARGPWHWIATLTPVERINSPDPDRYTLEFLPDSTARMLLDCNRGNGAYHVDGRSLRVGPIAATRMMCRPGSLDTVFAKQLDAARIWFMQGDTLMLDLLADSGTMRFVR